MSKRKKVSVKKVSVKKVKTEDILKILQDIQVSLAWSLEQLSIARAFISSVICIIEKIPFVRYLFKVLFIKNMRRLGVKDRKEGEG